MLFSTLIKDIDHTVISGSPDKCTVDSLCRDSREKCENGLFVCIKGAKSDGHNFAQMAYDNGCRAFVATRHIELPGDAVVILTSDTRIALAEISAAFYGYPSKELKVIGITGTKGKTTTALTVYEVLNSCGIPSAYIGSNGIKFNGQSLPTLNTTPESAELQKQMRAMADSGISHLVMEVSSQALYMNRIHGIEFETVAFTNLSVDHIGGAEHPTFEHYRDCKKRLFTDFGAKNIVYNSDDPYAEYMVGDIICDKKIGCSPAGNRASDIYAEKIENKRLRASLSVFFEMISNGKVTKASMPMPGAFSVANALLATAICKTAGLNEETIADKLSSVRAEGRFETISAPSGALFIIDYAHNGVALTAALNTIREFSPAKLYCLFGSVGGRTEGRRRELGEVAAALADFCILTSDNPDFEDPQKIINDISICFTEKGSCSYVAIPDRREAIRFAVANAKPSDVVLLAGKGHEDYQLVCGQKLSFSERDVLKEAISALATV